MYVDDFLHFSFYTFGTDVKQHISDTYLKRFTESSVNMDAVAFLMADPFAEMDSAKLSLSFQSDLQNR